MTLRGVLVVEDEPHGAGGCPRGVPALARVANRAIAEHVLDELRSTGLHDVVVVCSHKQAADVRAALGGSDARTDVRLEYVEHDGPLELAAALSLAAPVIGEAPCVVHLASGLLGESLSPLMKHPRSPDIVVIVHQHPDPDDRLSAATQNILRVADLHPERAALGVAGVWLLGPGALRHFAPEAWHSRTELGLTDVAGRVAGAGGSLEVRLADSWRNYRGSPLDLLELNQIALDRLPAEPRRVSSNGNWTGTRIEGRVQIHESASIRHSVIVGPTVIGAEARISDSYVGPYTSIGERVRIEGAEIERSVIASGASITHIAGRLVASVVGRDARIFRDFSLPRALRLRVGDGTEVALC